MYQETAKRFIRRPVFKSNVPDGQYNGKITAADISEVDSTKYPGEKFDVLNFKVKVKDDEGNEVTLLDRVTCTWGRNGRLMARLESLGMLPEEGEDLDLDAFIGLQVTVQVENSEKDGRTYSNIINMEKEKPAISLKRSAIKKLAPRPTAARVEVFGDDEE